MLAVVLTVLAGGLLLRARRSGALGRRWRAGAGRGRPCPRLAVALVPAGQLLLLLAVLTALFAPEEAVGGLVPTPEQPGATWPPC